jgi:hypothetical protein
MVSNLRKACDSLSENPERGQLVSFMTPAVSLFHKHSLVRISAAGVNSSTLIPTRVTASRVEGVVLLIISKSQTESRPSDVQFRDV